MAGNWHVIAHIPAKFERQACNAVVSLTPREDGSIQTTYRFAEGTPDGARKLVRARAYVPDPANRAGWRVQFFWPFAWPVNRPCEVAWLDPEYRAAIVVYPKRKYAWLLSRAAGVEESRYEEMIGEIRPRGYDLSRVRRVPQVWPVPAETDRSG
jgi:apolipoprotein D and lipocalin family protein